FFPGALIVAADNQDTPRPGINKTNERNNVKPGWSNKHSNTEFNWEEIQGGSPGSGGGGEGGNGNDTSNPGGGEGGNGNDTSNPGGGEGGNGDGTSNPGGGEGGNGDGTSNPGGGEGGSGDGTSNSGGSNAGGYNDGSMPNSSWDSINGKDNPLNGIYPLYPYGPGNGG